MFTLACSLAYIAHVNERAPGVLASKMTQHIRKSISTKIHANPEKLTPTSDSIIIFVSTSLYGANSIRSLKFNFGFSLILPQQIILRMLNATHHTCFFFYTYSVPYFCDKVILLNEGTQIPGTRSPWWLNFVGWWLIFVGLSTEPASSHPSGT